MHCYCLTITLNTYSMSTATFILYWWLTYVPYMNVLPKKYCALVAPVKWRSCCAVLQTSETSPDVMMVKAVAVLDQCSDVVSPPVPLYSRDSAQPLRSCQNPGGGVRCFLFCQPLHIPIPIPIPSKLLF